MTDPAELIDGLQRPERTVQICMRGDLSAAHEDLIRELAEAQQVHTGSLAGNPRARELAEEIAALEARMRESTIEFRLQALPRRDWAAMVAAHPPRRGDDGLVLPSDAQGINADSFVEAIVHACVFEPKLTPEQWAKLDAGLTEAQYAMLSDAAWAVNRKDVDVPFSRAASRIRQVSDQG